MVLNHTFQYSTSFSIIGSLINFYRLKHADRTIGSICSIRHSIDRFHRLHGKCRRSIFSFNRLFGRQLLIYIVLCTPTNAFMLLSMLLGRLPRNSWASAFGLFGTQAAYIFGVHLLAAVQYPQRIHHISKRLLQINALYFTNIKLNKKKTKVRTHLKLYWNIALLHVTNRYGITYGSFGLASLQTFVKVILLFTIFVLIIIFNFNFIVLIFLRPIHGTVI